MLPMQPVLVYLTPSLAPVMLSVALALVGSAALFVREAFRATPRRRRGPAAPPAPLAA